MLSPKTFAEGCNRTNAKSRALDGIEQVLAKKYTAEVLLPEVLLLKTDGSQLPEDSPAPVCSPDFAENPVPRPVGEQAKAARAPESSLPSGFPVASVPRTRLVFHPEPLNLHSLLVFGDCLAALANLEAQVCPEFCLHMVLRRLLLLGMKPASGLLVLVQGFSSKI